MCEAANTNHTMEKCPPSTRPARSCAAIPKDEEVKEALGRDGAPRQFSRRRRACFKCTIHPDEIRAIFDLFADKMLNIPSKVLVDRHRGATTSSAGSTACSIRRRLPRSRRPRLLPPPPPAAGADRHRRRLAGGAAAAADRRPHDAAPVADPSGEAGAVCDIPETIAPQFPETTRSADAPLGARLTIPLHLKADYHAREVGYASGHLEETAAAFAARQANAAGKGAAGKPLIEKDVTAALAGRLTVPTTASEPPAHPSLPPYGLDYHLDLLDISDEQENVGPPAKVQTPRLTAPYPTLDPSQLAALEARDLEKRRLGPLYGGRRRQIPTNPPAYRVC